MLNYSAIFDEVEDFEANIRNISGPGPLAAPLPCSAPPPGDEHARPEPRPAVRRQRRHQPGAVRAERVREGQRRPAAAHGDAGRQHHQVPALTALREWVKLAVRTPQGPSTSKGVGNRLTTRQISQGRTLFTQAGCAACHVGGKWTISTKDFASPPAATEIFTETTPPATFGAPIGAQYLNRFLRDIGSFNLGVKGGPNPLGANVGGDREGDAGAERARVSRAPAPDALGIDYNGDGRGNGYNVPSLLGIDASPPYYHNGACESLACVVGNLKHRTRERHAQPDRLPNAATARWS